ncbi:DEAD/DEAH box helicase [Runella aurantiaca]|uniref:Serine/threonine protein phosphatase n=1 Tax=Runella aurantiaca TaxID=2282308 RepID=A0A369I3U4_9BACT|nr:SNF2-related protein [Runella aurantiaca]RDB03157.1 serine/threonine protein phosphatase [Runella aurantiaca]
MAYFKGLIIESLTALRKEASSAVRQRGNDIFRSGGVKIASFDGDYYAAKFNVESQSSSQKYEVELSSMDDTDAIECYCSCPSEVYPCKHGVAAAYALENFLSEGSEKTKPTIHDLKKIIIDITDSSRQIEPQKLVFHKPTLHRMTDTTVVLRTLDDQQIQNNVPLSFWASRRHYLEVKPVEQGKGYERFELSVRKKGVNTVLITRLEKFKYHFSCTCQQELRTPLCEHMMGVLVWLKQQRGLYALELLKNWEREKDALLAKYGYTSGDNLVGKFDFKINHYGELELVVLDKSIQPIAGVQWGNVFKSTLPIKSASPFVPAENAKDKPVFVYLLEHFTTKELPFFRLEVGKGFLNAKTGKVAHFARINWTDKERPAADATDLEIMNSSRLLGQEFMHETLRQRGFKLSTSSWNIKYTEEIIDAALEITGKVLEKLFPLLVGHAVRVNQKISSHSTGTAVTVSETPLDLHFQLSRTEQETILEAFVKHGNETLIPFQELTDLETYWLALLPNDLLCRFRSAAAAKVARHFFELGGAIRLRSVRDDAFFNGFVIPLADQFSVEFDKNQAISQTDLEWQEGRVYLKEADDNLLIVPVFVYTTEDGDEIELPRDFRQARVNAYNNTVQIQRRDRDSEETFVQFLQKQHPAFEHQTDEYFYLPSEQVLEAGWLFQFYEALNQYGTKLFGFNNLKKFRYNPNKATFKIRNSSGIDWFDLQVEVSFGDQSVALADVRKAILKKQNYVELKDGSYGLLPEEWVAQYAQLFRFGKVDEKKGVLRLSKQHFTILERYKEFIETPKLLEELDEKREKLLNFTEIKKIKLPKNITATLRPYQEEGYKWLHFLDEFGWGGCLADDMGLGKTLQMLTFLQEQKNRNPKGVHLVVVPKTLIFNWQAEAAKFCPELTLYVHTGPQRTKNAKVFNRYDIILSTYGSVRSDIELLSNFRFHYVVLDEAQAIKNPDSMISKAVKLLNAQNRLTMTGTPVENNTFDLYSQFDFLNPGFLGHEDFFRTEYATLIDKYQDKTRAAELRRLIYPFMLKRTKEEVAKDLPEKTETVLYCEMDKRQRKVYNAFRDKYRDMIAGKMAEVGREQASFLILEGLLKLRQICDSPALLSDDEDYGQDSVKLAEIVREIEENASHHKIVIFSQFLKMLDLIRQKLERDRIPYEYLDGKTQDRAERVNRFQGDDECRVFLMSLKAGGVGLNLTEADYVYLVDPWWNPAVEQQAIDRVHRIGQTKRVFAYRMICKDTVEEKIVQLQDRKRALADDLVSTEAGFLKKLTQDDILGLFS